MCFGTFANSREVFGGVVSGYVCGRRGKHTENINKHERLLSLKNDNLIEFRVFYCKLLVSIEIYQYW